MQSIHNDNDKDKKEKITVCDISKIRNVVNSQHVLFLFFYLLTVCDISKIRNVVNSQPTFHFSATPLHCLRYIKDTKCSQFTTTILKIRFDNRLFAIYQRYEMQSIHNAWGEIMHLTCTVCDISKIRNVVNSQHQVNESKDPTNCLRYIKDTKCSQFTTHRFG